MKHSDAIICRSSIVALALLALSGLPGCKATLTPQSLFDAATAIKDARKDLSPENEYYVGRSVATNLLSKYDYRYLDAEGISSGQLDGLTEYVSQIGHVLAFAAMETAVDGDRPAPLGGWHFTIVDDESINAFAAPGGYVFITRGAIAAARNEDELAAVVAHEVAHVVGGHALGSIKKSRTAGLAKRAFDSTVELDKETLGRMAEGFEGALDDISTAIFVKGYSRDTEFDADKRGAQIMAAAGYNPTALTRYLKTLAQQQDTGKGGFSATHPSASDRIKKLSSLVKTLPSSEIAVTRSQRFSSIVEN